MPEKPTYGELIDKISRLERDNQVCRQLRETVRRQEEELKKSEEKLRLLFERTPISYQSLDAEGRFIEVNQAWLDTLGYTKDEVIGRSFADFLHPDWVYHFRESFPRFKAIGEVLGVEFEMRKKDGSNILVAFHGKTGKDEKGNLLQTHCIFNDISEKRLSEKELLMSKERYRIIFEKAPVGIVHCDHTGKFFKTNDQFSNFSGYSNQELRGMDFDSVTYPEDRREDTVGIGNLLSGKSQLFSRDKRFVRKDGAVIWGHVKVSMVADETGKDNFLLAFVNDITERKKVEQALVLSEENYRGIFEQAAVGIVNCSLDGRYLRVNPVFADFVGYSEQELLEMNFRDVTHPDDLQAEIVTMDLRRKGVKIDSHFDKRYIRKDGSIVWGSLSSELMVDENGQPLMFLGIVQNIHARKIAQEALKESEQRHRIIFENSPLGMLRLDSTGIILDCNKKFVDLMGANREKIIGFDYRRMTSLKMRDAVEKAMAGEASVFEGPYTFAVTGKLSFLRVVYNPVTPDHVPSAVIATVEDIEKRRLAEEVIKRRILALTQPLHDASGIVFEDLFAIEDIQLLQDQFAKVTGVASIITRPDGTPITRPSNFTRLCNDIIRKNAKGLANCYRSDAMLGRLSTKGPLVQPCMSGGLWDAGAGISVGGRHVANWLIGQVRDKTQSDEKMRKYANEIGVEEETFIEAFHEVPSMTKEHFAEIAEVLFTLANRLSVTAYQNVQQARFITEIKQAQEQLRENENRLRFALEGANDGIWDVNMPTGEMYLSPRACEILGYPSAKMPDVVRDWRELVHPDDMQLALDRLESHLAGESPIFEVEQRLKMRSGDWKWVLTRGKVVKFINNNQALRMTGTYTDITERKQIEKEKAQLQSQLAQAQKMESVGRLAGGVAHDFNNMLGVILGHTELAQDQIAKTEPIFEDLEEIKIAAQRSADLTRQLLAFARKQTVSPKVLNLNETVDGLLKMLLRLIGEDIDLVWLPAKDLWRVKMDPTQVDQVLANLTVNARDAIEGVGKISIETGNKVFTEEYYTNHDDSIPGDFVMLSIKDNGCGMDKQTQEHIFEPFFTTKGVGRGTGLGLATIYGIIKQNGGFINVYSELGQGTVFKIYLPRHIAQEQNREMSNQTNGMQKGYETILIVEDEPSIMNLGKRMLESLGYRVITADSPQEALRLAESKTVEIHLLITDVVMPQMNGRDLASRLISSLPDLKYLFMSGYTANAIAHHGVLDEGVSFIQKPFSKKELAIKVREALDQETGDRRQETDR